ncbi:Nematode resistance protein-like HSPRO2 [Hondaea fermentalgiana]|uniref:Nematode resistance protein-like HSPRO2 n=1 Tax=Hondaea fermentalgiana TaxID=2315210 RepID=A0A2R5G9A1_9STRA|nr:Nematode resistance protein-like HSPRO2 [Hondaea fermentalgiana]|eukprot:GBG27115.1 Nematode resistance protein-like HSPRO2 [Hondaea fermentalgiana]
MQVASTGNNGVFGVLVGLGLGRATAATDDNSCKHGNKSATLQVSNVSESSAVPLALIVGPVAGAFVAVSVFAAVVILGPHSGSCSSASMEQQQQQQQQQPAVKSKEEVAAKVAATKAKREARIRDLYEDYVFLHGLRDSWNAPLTKNARLEPCFTAGMQGVELALVLLAHFINDDRPYVVKRPRIEMIAADIERQFQLLAEVIDGELEEERLETDAPPQPIGSLLQRFPIEDGPPTAADTNIDRSRQSSALKLVIEAVERVKKDGDQDAHEAQSLRKIVRNITGAFTTCFGDWSVGVGVEEQLSALRELVGLSPYAVPYGRKYLAYEEMVRSAHVASLLTDQEYQHKEDFFFRAIHLGTECWAFVLLDRISSAQNHIKRNGHFCNAAACVRVAASTFEYLGAHVMMLTSMVLRDYLELKVEIEGTSGAGSTQVKQFRKRVEELMQPVLDRLVDATAVDAENPQEDENVQDALLELYAHPERQPAIYEYIKSLEIVESALIGGFYQKHFILATNVIGSAAKGTMKMSVMALKKTFEKPVFPVLDHARSELGRITDERLAHLKGRIMYAIEENRGSSPSRTSSPNPASDSETSVVVDDRLGALYSTTGVPRSFGTSEDRKLAFLDHAWGDIPPRALYAGLKELYRLYHVEGNHCWDILFGQIMPEASTFVREILRLESSHPIEFGHNSHEVVSRLLSQRLEKALLEKRPEVVITTDNEFYSMTRQMNRMRELGEEHFKVITVPIEPRDTLEARIIETIEATPVVDLVYVSQCTYLQQQTLLPDVAAFSHRAAAALDKSPANKDSLVIVDGYHGFGALPTDLSGAETTRFHYVAGMLKHVGSSSNACFIALPPKRSVPRPLFTGWLADPSVLGNGSDGIKMGSEANFCEGFSLLGGTPSFLPCLVVFVHVMRMWREQRITVPFMHDAVLKAQASFLKDGVASEEAADKPFSKARLVSIANDPATQSHTLVFRQDNAEVAAKVVAQLSENHNIDIDLRKNFVRVGFGPYHTPRAVDRLNEAIRAVNSE